MITCSPPIIPACIDDCSQLADDDAKKIVFITVERQSLQVAKAVDSMEFVILLLD